MTQAEVASINAILANGPGDTGFQMPGIAAGAPVPLVPANDAATFRDIARALELVVSMLTETKFRTRICSGHSSGAKLAAAHNFGRSPIGASNLSLRTGGNHVVPYDGTSPRIFDAFLLYGFPYDSDAERADTAFPISAPVVFVQGRGDERYQHPIRMAHELLVKGVSLNSALRIYEVKGLTHVPRDVEFETPQAETGEAIGCFVSAAIRNLLGQVNSTATIAPILEDPTIDGLLPDPLVVPRPIGPPETGRWIAVTAALAHETDAITPPSIAYRVGGYRLRFSAPELVPFPMALLSVLYGSFEDYARSIGEVVDRLALERLYDDRVESAGETAKLSRTLFSR